ncbi:unnamed protein product [Clonostachys chloroleuca]|uniref:Uncharacterized protein n=1 Tax=Clonostachys chloroleuca TaxID=1926264 RepID=A0AA35M586_9HYPO|nr:unnamed protein product [Clonostachys chloroleuca]
MSSQDETAPPYEYIFALRHSADRETRLWWRKRKGKGTITIDDKSIGGLDNDGNCVVASGSVVYVCEMEAALVPK